MTESSLSTPDFLVLFGAFLGLLIAFGFILKRGTVSNYVLSLFLFICFVRLGLKFIDESGLILQYSHLSRLNHVFGLLTPPIFYLYIYYFLRPGKWFRKVDFLHVVPTALLIIYLFPYFLLSGKEKLAVLTGIESSVSLPHYYGLFGFIYSTMYLCLSLFQIIKSKGIINSKKGGKAWIYSLLFGYFIFLALAGVNFFTGYSFDLDYLLFQALSLMIIFIGLKLLSISSSYTDPEIKYQGSRLDKASREKYFTSLIYLMEAEMPFKSTGIKLSEMADTIGIKDHELSQVINETLNISFNEFINRYRIDCAKKMLLDKNYANLTIEGIAYESGFNSRTSFYQAFKSMVGSTPRDYKNNHVKNN